MHRETNPDADSPPSSNPLEEVAAGQIIPNSIRVYERRAQASSLQKIGIEFTFLEGGERAVNLGNGGESTFSTLGRAVPNQVQSAPTTFADPLPINVTTTQYSGYAETVIELWMLGLNDFDGRPNTHEATLNYGEPRAFANTRGLEPRAAFDPAYTGAGTTLFGNYSNQIPQTDTPMTDAFVTPSEGLTPFSPAFTATTLDVDDRDQQLLETPEIGGNPAELLGLLFPTPTPVKLFSATGDSTIYATPMTSPSQFDQVPGEPIYGDLPNKSNQVEPQFEHLHSSGTHVEDHPTSTNIVESQARTRDWLQTTNQTIYFPTGADGCNNGNNSNSINTDVASNAPNTTIATSSNNPVGQMTHAVSANASNSFAAFPQSNSHDHPNVDFGEPCWFNVLFPNLTPGTIGNNNVMDSPHESTSNLVDEGILGDSQSSLQHIIQYTQPSASPIRSPRPLASRISFLPYSPHSGSVNDTIGSPSEETGEPLSLYDRIYNYPPIEGRLFPRDKQMLMEYIADGISLLKLFPHTPTAAQEGTRATATQDIEGNSEQAIDVDHGHETVSQNRSRGLIVCHGTHRLSRRPENEGEWEPMVCLATSRGKSAYQKHIKTVHLGLNHRQLSLLNWLKTEGFYDRSGQNRPRPESLIQSRNISITHLKNGEEPWQVWLAHERGFD